MRRRDGLTDLWTKVNGWRMYARAATGQAPPGAPAVVLVHGLGVSSRYMVPTARELAPWCRVFAPDLPGFGWSDKPDRVLEMDELAEALVAWLDAARLGRVALLGNSLGCLTLAVCAARHPDRVSRLVLQGPAPDPSAPTVLGQLVRLAADTPRERFPQQLIVARDYLLCGFRRGLRTLKNGLAYPWEDVLPRVAAPALAVRGDRDAIVPQAWADRVAGLLPHGGSVVLPGPHTLNYSAPRELVGAVRPFLLGESAGGRPRTSLDSAGAPW